MLPAADPIADMSAGSARPAIVGRRRSVFHTYNAQWLWRAFRGARDNRALCSILLNRVA